MNQQFSKSTKKVKKRKTIPEFNITITTKTSTATDSTTNTDNIEKEDFDNKSTKKIEKSSSLSQEEAYSKKLLPYHSIQPSHHAYSAFDFKNLHSIVSLESLNFSSHTPVLRDGRILKSIYPIQITKFINLSKYSTPKKVVHENRHSSNQEEIERQEDDDSLQSNMLINAFLITFNDALLVTFPNRITTTTPKIITRSSLLHKRTKNLATDNTLEFLMKPSSSSVRTIDDHNEDEETLSDHLFFAKTAKWDHFRLDHLETEETPDHGNSGFNFILKDDQFELSFYSFIPQKTKNLDGKIAEVGKRILTDLQSLQSDIPSIFQAHTNPELATVPTIEPPSSLITYFPWRLSSATVTGSNTISGWMFNPSTLDNLPAATKNSSIRLSSFNNPTFQQSLSPSSSIPSPLASVDMNDQNIYNTHSNDSPFTRTLTKKPSLFADRWIPDQDTNVCMICKVTKFTLFIRRHHCRRCGKVICWKCSIFKEFVPSTVSPQESLLENTMNHSFPVRFCIECCKS